jgi:hypothetical protein
VSNTSPSETARIHAIAGDDPYRRELLTSVALLLERSENNIKWQIQHEIRDDKRFEELDERLGDVTSSVNTEQVMSRYTLKEMVVGTIFLCGSIGALIGFIVWAIGTAVTKP